MTSNISSDDLELVDWSLMSVEGVIVGRSSTDLECKTVNDVADPGQLFAFIAGSRIYVNPDAREGTWQSLCSHSETVRESADLIILGWILQFGQTLLHRRDLLSSHLPLELDQPLTQSFSAILISCSHLPWSPDVGSVGAVFEKLAAFYRQY